MIRLLSEKGYFILNFVTSFIPKRYSCEPFYALYATLP